MTGLEATNPNALTYLDKIYTRYAERYQIEMTDTRKEIIRIAWDFWFLVFLLSQFDMNKESDKATAGFIAASSRAKNDYLARLIWPEKRPNSQTRTKVNDMLEKVFDKLTTPPDPILLPIPIRDGKGGYYNGHQGMAMICFYHRQYIRTISNKGHNNEER